MKKIYFTFGEDSFLYCWTDKHTNKLYVGVHKGHQSDGYICSSKHMLEEYKKRPQDFSRQIIATGTLKDMFLLENKILTSVNAKKDPLFYNRHNGDGNFYNKGHTEETKNKLRRKLSSETKARLRNLRLKQVDPRKGKRHSEASKKQISEAKKGNQCRSKIITINGITYSSLKNAAKSLNVNYGTFVSHVNRGYYE